MKVMVSGTRNGAGDLDEKGRLVTPPIEWPPLGGEIEVPDGEGADLVSSGMATEVKSDRPAKPEPKPEPEPEPVVETATADDSDVETTALTTDTGPVKRGPGRPRKNP